MEPHYDLFWKLLSSLAAGLLIGTERGWYGRKEDEGDRIAGIRTFSLTGLLGGILASLSAYTGEWILAVAFLGLSGLLITSYVYEKKVLREEDIGITTEIALLITFALGTWAGFGHQLEAVISAVAVMAILSMKPVLHKWLEKIDLDVFYGGVKLLVISVILLPVLPDRGFGPWNALNPYWIWWMVVLISGLSFIGYVLRRYAGNRRGTVFTSLLGGLASSTAVTISLGQIARKRNAGKEWILSAGVLIASTIMFVRVAVEVSIVNIALLNTLWLPLLVMLVATAAAVYWMLSRREEIPEPDAVARTDAQNPLQLFTAIKFGLLLGLILLLAEALEVWVGDKGVYLLAVFSGLMDVDAVTLSLSRMAVKGLSETVASFAILLAVVTNTLVKGGLFVYAAGLSKSKELIWTVIAVSASGLLTAAALLLL